MSDAKSILLIDDNDKDRQYYTHRLKVSSPHDYVIFEATTGQVGLDIFKAHRIDCVILEFSLPTSDNDLQ
jgi:CheY-like chemotaxis protein